MPRTDLVTICTTSHRYRVVNVTMMDRPFHLHGFFCHILEHHTQGMMAHFEVVP